jgi:molybdate-binding protein
MKLSEQLQQDHDCGAFGKALEGYAEQAKQLEEIVEAVAHVGIDTGYGVYEIQPEDIERARKLLTA